MNKNAQYWLDTLSLETYPKATRLLGGPNHGYDALGVAVLLYEQEHSKLFPRDPVMRNFIHNPAGTPAKALMAEYAPVIEWLGLLSPWGHAIDIRDPTITMLNDGFQKHLPMTHASLARYLLLCKKAYFED